MKEYPEIGSLVTAYEKGYWKLIEIEKRYLTKSEIICGMKGEVGDEYSPLAICELVMNSKFGVPKSPKQRQCDISYCKPITQEMIDEMRKTYNDGLSALEKVLHEHSSD
jgi:hypothetical protein